MKIHELKLDEKYFDLVRNGTKTFEIRKNDRDYRVGDLLALSRYDSKLKSYRQNTFFLKPGVVDSVHEADTIFKRVSYVTDFEQKDGYVVLGLSDELVLSSEPVAEDVDD
ncbi:DUF3850 domain-containing protein [Fructobacillus cardui]|uniref:DUF3850 domain-containing protein n=1 Tax=Fructobacillus cardui TaxID=2893170 RepID=A0ABM9MUE0_9LACO|nr:hypothetical protein R82641_BJNNKPBH_00750 [Fructobacillus cardui]